MAFLLNGAKAFLGTFVTDAATLTFIQANNWDSNSDGTGTPQNGMFYYNTTVNARRLYLNGVWVNDTLNQQQIYFVSKAGLDTNSGLNQDDPFLTIGAAITAVTAQVPAANNRFAIIVLDAGIYTEDLTVPSWVSIRGLECTVNGSATLADDSSLAIASCTLAAGIAVTKSVGVGAAFADIRELRLSGGANGCLCSSGELLVVNAGLIEVEDGYGAGTISTTGILHCVINNISITGTGIGIGAAGVGATLAGTINTVQDLPGNGTGVYVGNGVTVNLSVQFLSCAANVAYNVLNGGTLALTVGTLLGTETIGATGIADVIRSDQVGLHILGPMSLNGQRVQHGILTELLTINAAASTDTTLLIPEGAQVFAVSVRVTVAIPTAATFTVGTAADALLFSGVGRSVAVALGTTDPCAAGGINYFDADTAVRITPNLAPATNVGRVRVTVHYTLVTPPTS